MVRGAHVQHHRLMVTEKDAEGFYRPVGVLGAPTAGQYTFHYLRSAVARPGFRPFLGFSDTGRSYRSDGLFPLFAERIMDPRRPEHPMYLAALDLSGDVTPLEVLARSGGQRAGDGIMLLPIPEVAADGSTHATFLVHGMRHVPGADERVGRLCVGDALFLRPDPDNWTNARAVLVVEGDDQPLGYVPDVLLDFVHSVDDVRLSVVRVNGPEVGSRLRLLVRLEGQADPDEQPFTGDAWETVD
ncbi:HIRAN domain-containing protein [Klenkia terrae]|uniref:HIRAN domain-containing protein n=2 Tax=Klenkia terrae TaxID=1052259 RepID=A0ABU8E666_9ACTN|nr:HIRAN domain-containing protein [Klenkia terrae]